MLSDGVRRGGPGCLGGRLCELTPGAEVVGRLEMVVWKEEDRGQSVEAKLKTYSKDRRCARRSTSNGE